MRSISLVAIELENFRSFRTRTRIELSSRPGLKFLSGDNKAEPRLGANGAGKSTIWDALSYCLYGVSVKGLKAADLASWGTTSPYVETEWWIDGEPLTIARRGSPNKLYFLDEDKAHPVEQINVDRAIGLSRARFLQSVLFGQGVPLFIDLPGPERGALLDEVLDLGLWLKAADLASKRHTELSRALDAINQEIARSTGKLEGLESLESIQAQIDTWRGEQDKLILRAIANVEEQEAALETTKQKVVTTTTAVVALENPKRLDEQVRIHQQAKADKEARYRELFREQQGAQKQIAFYEHTKNCPECGQTISATYARERLTRLKTLKADSEDRIQGNGAQRRGIEDTLNRLVSEQDKLSRRREFLLEQRTIAAAKFREQERVVESVVNIVEQLMEATNPHTARHAQVTSERIVAQAKLKATQAQKRQSQARLMRLDFWRAAFKRVRLFMVKRVLSQLEVETKAATLALGLVDWTIAFATELETKSGTIRPGIHIQVTSPKATAPWEAWSGGEGQRIRLAVALGLSSLIQRQAGVSIDFEVWDEPSAWLSPEGIEDLLECLEHRVATTRKSLWVCDHRGLQYSSFSEVWSVTKTEAGSEVDLISDSSV